MPPAAPASTPASAPAPSGRGRSPRSAPPANSLARNAVYVVGVAAVVAIVAVMLIVIRSCVPTSTYDYNGTLDFDDGSSAASASAAPATKGRFAGASASGEPVRGIDVSENQGAIDWEAVANDGIDFAIIRLGYRGATEGVLYLDYRFEEYLEGARAAGIPCGVYFFSQAKTEAEAREEADFVIKSLGGSNLEYPIAFDFEPTVPGVDVPRTAGLGKDEVTANARAFCDQIEKAGYYTMIYGNYYDLDLFHYESLQDEAIWWAEYDVDAPSPHLDIVMWQYASQGWVNGISTPVDMNLLMPEGE